jgi:hypothetical protein
MKTVFLLLLLVVTQAVPAQVFNGSFEQDGQYSLAGWEPFNGTHFYNCGDLPEDSTTGFFSMKIQAHVNIEPPFSNDCYVFQRLPSVEDGQELILSYWVMRHPLDIGTPRAWLGVMSNELSIPHVVPEMVIEALPAAGFVWQHVTAVVPWVADLLPGDTAAVALVTDNTPNPNQYIVFDGVELSGSTHVSEAGGATVSFWPNPAEDKLWVDLVDSVRAVTLVDQAGRSMSVAFLARSGMVEVDIANISPGLHTLLIATQKGSRSLRFVKA